MGLQSIGMQPGEIAGPEIAMAEADKIKIINIKEIFFFIKTSYQA
jgi:hypothetical protein